MPHGSRFTSLAKLAAISALVICLIPVFQFLHTKSETGSNHPGSSPVTGSNDSKQQSYPSPEQTSENINFSLCKFNEKSVPEIAEISLSDYIFSDPKIVHASPRNIWLVDWLPDNQSVLLTRDNSDQDLQSIELFNPTTGEFQTYAER